MPTSAALSSEIGRRPQSVTAGRLQPCKRIGAPQRQLNHHPCLESGIARLRGSLRLTDFLAICADLDLNPAEFIKTALEGNISPENRPPGILLTAWQQLETRSKPGIGSDRLDQLQSALHTDPVETRATIKRELADAAQEEVPLLLGLYGSALRLEVKVPQAIRVLKVARDIAHDLHLTAAEADLIIRLSYAALEQENLPQAIRLAEQGLVLLSRLHDREGEARGFLARGTFQLYCHDYHEALQDLQATIKRSAIASRLAAAHQASGLCWIALEHPHEAQQEADKARAFAPQLPHWMQGNLEWLEARLATGQQRIQHLQTAQKILCPGRPADCVQVTVELIETALNLDDEALAFKQATGLCALVEQSADNPRVQKAVTALIRQRTQLTPELVANIRNAIDRAQTKRISHILNPDP